MKTLLQIANETGIKRITLYKRVLSWFEKGELEIEKATGKRGRANFLFNEEQEKRLLDTNNRYKSRKPRTKKDNVEQKEGE